MSDDDTTLEAVEVPLLLNRSPKILFGMTGRQVLLLLGGFIVFFSVWKSLAVCQSPWGVVLLACLCLVPAALIAFVSIGIRPLEQWFFILLAWMLTPDRLSSPRQLLRTFVKVRSICAGIAALDMGSRRGQLEYQGVALVESSRSFDLLGASEQAAMIESFGKVLDGLSYPVTIHMRTLPHIPAMLSSTLVSSDLPRPLRRFHAHYLSYLSQLVQEKRPVQVLYYVVVPAGPLPGEKGKVGYEHAKAQITDRVHELSRQLARAGLSLRRLSSLELFKFYHSGFSLLKGNIPSVDSDVIQDAARLPMLLAPLEIAIGAARLQIKGEEQGQPSHYLACLAVDQLPRRIYPGWLHRIIATNEPYLNISIHVQPHESDVVAMRLRKKAIMLGGALLASKRQGPEGGGNTITRFALKDIEHVREQLVRKDAHIYSVTLLFLVRALSRNELDERVRRIQLALRSLDFHTTALRFQQHLGYFSSLYGQNMLRYYGHQLPTRAAATCYPFSISPAMDSGVLLGMSNGNLVSFDPYGSEKLNANLAVLGVPGSGKSFCLKVLLSRLAPFVALSVIDIEDEYTRLVQALGGKQIDLTADSFHMNPFELYIQNKEHAFREKIAMLVGFFALLIGEDGTFTQHESAFIHRCLAASYAAVGITDDPATHDRPVPSVRDFAALLQQEESTSDDLSLRLAPYLHLFPACSQVTSSQHIVYELKQLPEALRPAATYLITEKLWCELQEGRQMAVGAARHLVVIDEAWFLSKYASGAALLNELARRIRKYGGGLWVSTQEMEDLLSSEQGKGLLALCETKMLFRQDVSSSDVVQALLHLSSEQAKLLRTASRGEALYISSKDVLAVEIVASPQEEAIAQTAIPSAPSV